MVRRLNEGRKEVTRPANARSVVSDDGFSESVKRRGRMMENRKKAHWSFRRNES